MKKSATGDSWCSPVKVRDAVWQFNGGPPRLDPASNPNSIMGAEIEWFGPHVGGTNGLLMPWHLCGGLVFDNPPYSDKATWMAKCAHEASMGAEIIALLPANTDTAWFHDYAVPAGAICYIRGRLIYGGDRAFPARFPSILIYWGHRISRFRESFSTIGWVT